MGGDGFGSDEAGGWVLESGADEDGDGERGREEENGDAAPSNGDDARFPAPNRGCIGGGDAVGEENRSLSRLLKKVFSLTLFLAF